MFETKEGVIKLIVYIGVINRGRLLILEYVNSPNPTKSGWWIPAPELKFGEDPEVIVQNTCRDLGLDAASLILSSIESFVVRGGWHFICHYTVKTNSELKLNSNIKNFKWVNIEELEQMKDMAHGKWEIEVGKKFLLEKEPSQTAR